MANTDGPYLILGTGPGSTCIAHEATIENAVAHARRMVAQGYEHGYVLVDSLTLAGHGGKILAAFHAPKEARL